MEGIGVINRGLCAVKLVKNLIFFVCVCLFCFFLKGLLHLFVSGQRAPDLQRWLHVPRLGLPLGQSHSFIIYGHCPHMDCREALHGRGHPQTGKSTQGLFTRTLPSAMWAGGGARAVALHSRFISSPFLSVLCPQRLEALWYPAPQLRKKPPVVSKSETDPLSSSRSDTKDSV